MKKVYLFVGCCFLLACGIFIGRAISFDRAQSGLDAPDEIITPEKPLETTADAAETTTIDVENADVTEYTIEKITEAETAAPPETVPGTSAPETQPPAETQAPISLTDAIVTDAPAPGQDAQQTQPASETAAPPQPQETSAPQPSQGGQAQSGQTAETTPPSQGGQPSQGTQQGGQTQVQTPAAQTPAPQAQAGDNLVDFSALQKVNGDIYAWITIDGTVVDYPILQHPTDDEYYLTHAFDGSDYIGGAVFTQGTYNTKSFDDPVTVVYAHTMKSGILFGSLQPTYSDAQGFKDHSDIKIYLPGEVRHYTVFAAVPYDNRHILWNYDFSTEYWYKNFFAGISQIRSIGSNFNRDIMVEPGDHVVILSTCLRGDSTNRFLVMAVLNEDI